jgi:hypothetical protein
MDDEGPGPPSTGPAEILAEVPGDIFAPLHYGLFSKLAAGRLRLQQLEMEGQEGSEE